MTCLTFATQLLDGNTYSSLFSSRIYFLWSKCLLSSPIQRLRELCVTYHETFEIEPFFYALNFARYLDLTKMRSNFSFLDVCLVKFQIQKSFFYFKRDSSTALLRHESLHLSDSYDNECMRKNNLSWSYIILKPTRYSNKDLTTLYKPDFIVGIIIECMLK